jgi:cytochrome c biogenesis protein CcdA
VADNFFGALWIVLGIFLVIGVFGLGSDSYKEMSKSNQDTAKFVGLILLIIVAVNLFKVAR